jgi:hypothetical protein
LKQPSTDQEKLENLRSLSVLVQTRSASDREFRRAIGNLDNDLSYLANSLVAEPQSWRQNRAFHIVHVPSFVAIMLMLQEVDQMESVSDEERHQILTSIHRSAQLAKEARDRIERTKLTAAKVELEVLSEYAQPPAQPYEKPSRFLRAFDSIAATSESVWSGAKSRANAIPDVVGDLQSGVSGTLTRAASAPALIGNLRKTIAGTLSDNISTPISMRLNASGQALKHGVGAGVGLGVVVGVLCPPLLPLTAGGAVLAAMRAWRKEMDAAYALNEAERDARIALLQTERAAALRQLTQGASALQMETEELSMTLDVETGDADAVILKGEYSGRTWSSLTSAEKAETGFAVLEGAASLLRIIEITLED